MRGSRSCSRLVLFNALLALIVAGGCSTPTEDDASESSSNSPPPSTHVDVFDFGYEMPDEISGPWIDLTITNTGKFAHELGFGQVKPGTTEEEIRSTEESEDNPSWAVGDSGGISLLTAGESLRYQRELDPGTYAFVCHFPMGDGTNHLQAGMVHVFEITDSGTTGPPSEDATVTVTDDGIELPPLDAGSQTMRFLNEGTRPHELGIGGVTADTDLRKVGPQIGAWFGGGQKGPPPGGLIGPGGHQTIDPGESVWLTVTLEHGYTYRFDDVSGKKPLAETITIK